MATKINSETQANGPVQPKQEKGSTITEQYLAGTNLPNFITFLSMISPYLVIFFILFNSIVNSNFIKGIVYLSGLMILFVIVLFFQKILSASGMHTPNPLCNLFQINAILYSIPSFSIALITYTMLYILLPMISNNVINYPFIIILFLILFINGLHRVKYNCNPFIIILFLILFINGLHRVKYNCTTIFGAVTGGFLGIVWGVLYYTMINSSDPKLTYSDDFLSNKVACSRPTEQKFKCSVYKNGELLQSI